MYGFQTKQEVNLERRYLKWGKHYVQFIKEEKIVKLYASQIDPASREIGTKTVLRK